MRRLIGLRDFVHDVIEKTTDLVEETHDAAAKKPIDVLSTLGLGAPAQAVDTPRALIAKLVFDSIRATNRTVQAVSDVGVAIAKQVLPEENAISVASKPKRQLEAWIETAESALNAVAGDFLAAQENGLSIQAQLRHQGHALTLTREHLATVLPEATPLICVFVHGLGLSDSVWLQQEPPEGSSEVSFGNGVQRALGYTPIYFRYNTGLHISQNGRALAGLLEELVSNYPVAVEEIALIGHSMGGLVSRSAAHYGETLEQQWITKLRHVLCIGSPHFGAPLERAGNVVTSVLAYFDTAGTQVPAKVFNARSAGIKDLRFGSVRDEDWQGHDPDAFFQDNTQHAAFVEGVSYGYIAARLQAASGFVGELVGDLLVQLPSASGQHRDPTRVLPFHMGHVVDGVNHVALPTNPAVYEQVLRFLRDCGPSPAALESRQLTGGSA
ncbi:MAG TPA: alpha/beta fold hydrolase [Polyangiales bacterium]|nr:alpha/beta fold hydrolase [Polyangiales bacterium]